ncbi:MAG: hypothetical protein K8R23_19425 [Chthoniobacter sp.]|nr:hypothetical protein [Chthoniobacter sp.]
MFDELPPKVSGWFRVFASLLITFVVLAILGVLLFPAISDHLEPGPKVPARMDSANLTTALRAYLAEYGQWPAFTGDGLFLDEVRNAQLLHTLCAKDDASNPRKILFFEGRNADKSRGKYRKGFNPETGAYIDPWGNPYRLVLDSDYDGQIANPYVDDPPIGARVIVWSPGKDGRLGAPGNPRARQGSDDVVSWQ